MSKGRIVGGEILREGVIRKAEEEEKTPSIWGSAGADDTWTFCQMSLCQVMGWCRAPKVKGFTGGFLNFSGKGMIKIPEGRGGLGRETHSPARNTISKGTS